MIIFNFTRMIFERDIKQAFAALVRAGFSTKFATKVTRNDFVKLNLEYLENLCVFFQCTPNDLLEWIPDTNDVNIENSHLHQLYRKEKPLSINEKLRNVSDEKLEEINKLIDAALLKGDKNQKSID